LEYGCGGMEQRERPFEEGSLRRNMRTEGVVGVQNKCQGPMVLERGNPFGVVGWLFVNFFSLM